MKSIFKKVLWGIPVLAIIAAVGFIAYSYMKANPNPYKDVDMAGVEIPKFNKVNFPFTHEYDRKTALPFLGSAIIDIDADGIPEVFMGGGREQKDAILKFDNGEFIDVSDTLGKGIEKSLPDPTFGAATIDADNNGRVDLFVARESGVTLYLNEESGFTAQALDIPFDDTSTPLSISLGDINNDGAVDMFISNYIKIDQVDGVTNFAEGYGATSLLLLNNGDNTFKDITRQAGVEFVHNTFTATFSDVDRDNDLDLVIVYDTGRVLTYRNRGDATFLNISNPGSNWCGYPMGVAVGDYNNNGHIDFFFSNVGYTPPSSIARGTLPPGVYHPELMLFSNQGEFNFTDDAPTAKIAEYEFSWGSVFDDLNNDGHEDLIIAQNYIDLPSQKLFKLPGRVLMQNTANEFAASESEMGLVNRNYEITPLLADFNNDGYRDMIRVNLAGPSYAYINSGGSNNYLKVQLPETAESIGAIVEIAYEDGSKRIQQFTSGEGLASDQSHEMIFGLGDKASVSEITATLVNGKTIQNGPANAGETVYLN